MSKIIEAEIIYTIRFNKGKFIGEEKEIRIDLDEIECSDLAGVLIEEGYLDSYCNNNEFNVLSRKIENIESFEDAFEKTLDLSKIKEKALSFIEEKDELANLIPDGKLYNGVQFLTDFVESLYSSAIIDYRG